MLRKEHWENIYANKKMNEVSWFQQEPTTSLALIQKNTQSNNESSSSASQDQPSAKNETAVANYQAVGNLAQRESVQKLFGVDLFA
mgnify:CR=1 FL=1